jgi:hypothetical protein
MDVAGKLAGDTNVPLGKNGPVNLEATLSHLKNLHGEMRCHTEMLRVTAAQLYGGVPTPPPSPEPATVEPTGLLDRLAHISEQLDLERSRHYELIVAIGKTLGTDPRNAAPASTTGR